MTDLAYDESIGWYDPAEAYCTTTGCRRPATTSRTSEEFDWAVCDEHSGEPC